MVLESQQNLFRAWPNRCVYYPCANNMPTSSKRNKSNSGIQFRQYWGFLLGTWGNPPPIHKRYLKESSLWRKIMLIKRLDGSFATNNHPVTSNFIYEITRFCQKGYSDAWSPTLVGCVEKWEVGWPQTSGVGAYALSTFLIH